MLDKTLEQLDGQEWGEPGHPDALVEFCHRMRRVPLGQLQDEDLARLIGQGIGLDFLVPLAMSRLLDEPLEGGWYDGQLLRSVLSLPQTFWQCRPGLRLSRGVVLGKARALLRGNDELKATVEFGVLKVLREADTGAA